MASRRVTRPYTEYKEFIEIEGDAVKLCTKTVNRVVKLEDFLSTVGNHSGTLTPVLPNGCRLFRQMGSITGFLVEKPPTQRVLHWVNMIPRSPENPKPKTSWRLAFPYTVFYVEFAGDAITTNCSIFYRNSPITSIEDKLLLPNLCNLYRNGRICTGSVRVTGNSMTEKADSFMTAFWQSEFNADLIAEHWAHDITRIPAVASLPAWEASSKEDPLFVLGCDWREYGTIANLFRNVGQG